MGIIILSGSSLILLFMSSLEHKSKLLIRRLDMFVDLVSIFLVIESSLQQHVFRKHLLGTESKYVVGAGNEQSPSLSL